MQETRSDKPPVILVVDDEDHIVRVVAFKLRSAGFEVIEAFDGEEAWTRLGEQEVDLVLTDRQMPIVDGIELSRRISADARTAEIPVVMLTARGFRLTPEELASAGVIELIDKPFSPRVLVERIRANLEARRGGEAAA